MNNFNKGFTGLLPILRSIFGGFAASRHQGDHSAYLNEAADGADLERRMRELDRPHHAVPLHAYNPLAR